MNSLIDSGRSKSSSKGKDTYWAAEQDGKILANSIIKRIETYRNRLRRSGLASRIRKSWAAYMGYGPRADGDTSRFTSAGDIGEILNLNINHYAALANQVVTLTIGNKPSVKAIASNEDFESLGQAAFAEALNDYYDRELSISDREFEATLAMVLFGESHIVEDWDATVGQPFMKDESGRLLKTGDVRVYSLTPFDVARDPDLQDIESTTWIAFRRRVNKWDLVAQYPKQKDGILSQATLRNGGLSDGVTSSSGDSVENFILDFRKRMTTEETDPDSLYMWEFRHIPTPALPNGRLIRFVSADCVLQDSVMVTKTLDATGMERELVEDAGYPFGDSLFVFSAAPDRAPGGIDGHTSFFDLLSMQEGLDLSASIIASAVNAGGLQNIYVKRGSNITANKLTGALNVIEYDGDSIPQAQSNVSLNPAVGQFAETMVNWMRQRVSLNEAVTGDLQRALPAQGLALLRAQAIEFHSRLQASYERLIQRTRTGVLKMLQEFAEADRVALIAGKSNSWALKSFKKTDISGFDRFIIEPVNPALKTLAGKVGFAQPLLEKGIIGPQQYLQLFSTGRLEPIQKFFSDNQARIEREKELLMQGVGLPPLKIDPATKQPVVNQDGIPEFSDDGKPHIRPLISDTFWSAIPEYLSVLAMPEIRQNPAVVKAVLELVDYCMKLWKIQPPAMTMLLRGVAFPQGGPGPAPVPEGAGPAPGGPPEPPFPPAMMEQLKRMSGAQAGPAGTAVNLPKPPELKLPVDAQLKDVADRNQQ